MKIEIKNRIEKCPDCGGDVKYYHNSDEYKGIKGAVTRVVCKNKCKGWKVLQEIDRPKEIYESNRIQIEE
jgi:hypothetical protein